MKLFGFHKVEVLSIYHEYSEHDHLVFAIETFVRYKRLIFHVTICIQDMLDKLCYKCVETKPGFNMMWETIFGRETVKRNISYQTNAALSVGRVTVHRIGNSQTRGKYTLR